MLLKMSKNQKNYSPLIIPIDKAFCELSEREAQEYFEWFLDHIDERSEYLRSKVAERLNISIETINYSFESLKLIWKWFLLVAEVSKTPNPILKKLEKSLRGSPRSFVDHMLEQSKEELSVFTEYVLRDIGMYLGKVFISNYPILKWTYRVSPRSDVHCNLPLIVGFIDNSYSKPFHPELEPIDLARTPAMNLFDNTQKESDLFEWCKKWEKWVPVNK